MLDYNELERRFGEPFAQFLVKEIEKAVGMPANNNDWDYARRLDNALIALDDKVAT